MLGCVMASRFVRSVCLRKCNSRALCNVIDPPGREPEIPSFQEKNNESTSVKRARLQYQSRKRGMLENDLLLSTFAAKYLATMDETMLTEYDHLINLPANDWDIYYWAVGAKPVPPEFNNQVMEMLKKHVRNKDREQRMRMPDLVQS